MLELMILLFILSLLRLAVSDRAKTSNSILAFQGFILFVVAVMRLKHLDVPEFLFIVTETLIFKTVIVPYLVFSVIKKNDLWKVESKGVKNYNALLLIIGAIVFSFALAYSLKDDLHDDKLEIKYFTAAIAALITGMFLIIVHENILPHLFGFLIIENAVFLLSLSVSTHMPLIVNMGILLDVFTTALILGLLINRIGDKFKDIHSNKLSQLKD